MLSTRSSFLKYDTTQLPTVDGAVSCNSNVGGFSQDCHKTQLILCSALQSPELGIKLRLPSLVRTRLGCILDKAGLVLGYLPQGIFPTSPPAF